MWNVLITFGYFIYTSFQVIFHNLPILFLIFLDAETWNFHILKDSIKAYRTTCIY